MRKGIGEEEETTNAIEMRKCFVIWAAKGILEDADIETSEKRLDLGVKITKFMLEGRRETYFGLYGWDQILPGAMIWETKVLSSHFSLVHRPNVGLKLFSKYLKFRDSVR